MGVSINGGGTPKWMVFIIYKRKSQSKMDDDWGYPHFGKPPNLAHPRAPTGRKARLGWRPNSSESKNRRGSKSRSKKRKRNRRSRLKSLLPVLTFKIFQDIFSMTFSTPGPPVLATSRVTSFLFPLKNHIQPAVHRPENQGLLIWCTAAMMKNLRVGHWFLWPLRMRWDGTELKLGATESIELHSAGFNWFNCI